MWIDLYDSYEMVSHMLCLSDSSSSSSSSKENKVWRISQTIHMKWQSLFVLNHKKHKCFNMSSAIALTDDLKVNIPLTERSV